MLPRRFHHLTTTQVDAAVARYQDGASLRQLGEQLGVDRKTISRHFKKRGVELRYRPISPDKIEQAVRLYTEGQSTARIAERMGHDTTTIYRQLKAAGVKMRDSHGRAPCPETEMDL